MYEYFCDHIIPGCTHKARGESPEALQEKALEHLEKRHGQDRDDEALKARVINDAMIYLPR